ncbi:hypothetical protein IE81DRAFT_57043 [Ceraceosorus guamensis]|uniref:Uncharacterized protein n=1 Tax=Ceraceosorus guamensis TaxID=1522189 RepID=A0A316VN21_9BASI|nr:hypothetical protein IE81DRAFT_57043 [Ceraceosorus guamensis]PWN39029.1 hypothetical protein IE81DRAFT_57043 [Ceraceosorus guamensis]
MSRTNSGVCQAIAGAGTEALEMGELIDQTGFEGGGGGAKYRSCIRSLARAIPRRKWQTLVCSVSVHCFALAALVHGLTFVLAPCFVCSAGLDGGHCEHHFARCPPN